jgi:HPt (histidine-containing phosphotransfer) domain-containing protein
MDAFLTKPITPEKLRAVLTGSREAGATGASSLGPFRGGDGPLVVDLAMIRHLAEGRPDGLERELSSFAASLDGAVHGVTAALATGSKPALASAAHRVLSHARTVGASSLARTASDLQEFGSAYSEAELADEIALLARLSAELRDAIERLRRPEPAR